LFCCCLFVPVYCSVPALLFILLRCSHCTLLLLFCCCLLFLLRFVVVVVRLLLLLLFCSFYAFVVTLFVV
jgi:hypothetical protein